MTAAQTNPQPTGDPRLVAVNFVADAINRAIDLEEIADNALSAVLAVMKLDAGAVYFWEEDPQCLRLFAWRGLPETLVQQACQIPRGREALFDEVLGGATRIIEDLVVSPDPATQAPSIRAGFRSAIVWPIRTRDGVVGVLVLGRYQRQEIVAADRDLIETICNQIGNAMVQAFLQADLRASEEKYRSMVETSDDAIYLADEKGRPLFANSSFERIFGYTVEELAHGEAFGRIHEKDARAVADAVAGLVHGVPVRNLEYSFQRKDGQWIDLECSGQVVTADPSNNPRLQFTVREVTEIKRRQRQLLQRNRQLGALTMVADVANSSLSIEQIARNTLEAALQATGIDAGTLHLVDAIGQPLQLYVQLGLPTDVARRLGTVAWGDSVYGQVAASGEAQILADLKAVDERVAAEVRRHFCSLIVVPVCARDELLGTLGFASRHGRWRFTREVVEMVQAIGNQLGIALANARLYENLQGKNRLLRLSIEEAHHRIKNNLQMVSGLLQLQAGDALEGDSAKHLRDANARIHAIAQVHHLLSQEMPEKVDIRELITSIGETLLMSTGRSVNSQDLELEVGEVWLSSEQAVAVALIVNELVANAFLHGRAVDGDSLRVKVSCHREHETVRLHVADNGGGFPSHQDRDRNTGQGLKIIKQLAQVNLRGNIAIEAAGPGVSAEVVFDLLPQNTAIAASLPRRDERSVVP